MKFVIAFIALLLSFGVAEIAIRFFGLAPEVAPLEVELSHGAFERVDDPRLVYVPRPSSGDINSYGIRDDEGFSDGEPFMITLLGDSVAFGYCRNGLEPIAKRDLFASILERKLNKCRKPDKPRVEIANLAVSGYNTRQQVSFFEKKGLNLSPKLVLVAYVLNDNDEHASLELSIFRRGNRNAPLQYANRTLHFFVNYSHLVRLLVQRLHVAGEGAASSSAQSSVTTEGFTQLRQLADESKFPVYVSIFPELWMGEDGNYRLLAQHRAVARKATSQKFPVFDLYEPLLRASDGDLSTLRGRCGGMHLDEGGHMEVAKILFVPLRAFLVGKGMLRERQCSFS